MQIILFGYNVILTPSDNNSDTALHWKKFLKYQTITVNMY